MPVDIVRCSLEQVPHLERRELRRSLHKAALTAMLPQSRTSLDWLQSGMLVGKVQEAAAPWARLRTSLRYGKTLACVWPWRQVTVSCINEGFCLALAICYIDHEDKLLQCVISDLHEVEPFFQTECVCKPTKRGFDRYPRANGALVRVPDRECWF